MQREVAVDAPVPAAAERVAPAQLLAAVQPKLAVGPAGDAYEREADAVAQQVVARLSAPRTDTATNDATINDDTRTGARQPQAGLDGQVVAREFEPSPAARGAHGSHSDGAGCNLCAGTRSRVPVVRRVASTVGAEGGEVDADTEQAIMSARSGGSAFEPAVRREMESAFGGADFSGVRLHAGGRAKELNQTIQAKAFTHGSDIFFRDGLPDTGRPDGQALLAHELTHTLQQSGGAQRRLQRKHDAIFQPATGKDPAKDWFEYSGGSTVRRSSELKAIDTAVAKWQNGTRSMQGDPAGNVRDLQAIDVVIKAWQKSKKGKPSFRDLAIAGLTGLVSSSLQTNQAKVKKKTDDTQIATPLFEKYKQLDDQTGQYAKKQTVDVKLGDFEPDNQKPTKMAHTDKDDQGNLTPAALLELDRLQIAEADALVQKARLMQVVLDPTVSMEMLRQAMEGNMNVLSERTTMPEFENILDPNTEAVGELTETVMVGGTSLTVTYDKSDVHAAERLAALTTAVGLINGKTPGVPNLKVYFPKAGRSITVDSKCVVTIGDKLADAVFYAPDFFAVSSAITGNPKTEKDPTGANKGLKNLSSALGADNALVHTIIHELGHAMHYQHDKGRFYNLNFAMFTGKDTASGDSYQDIAMRDVSGYGGGNPREMVAEVFLGTIQGGKQFPAVVWEMYDAFGGCPLAH
jgi:hypothetical protein